ncbi:MAG: FecR domain-containing protein, partial [Planctomycetes bacterium]|nr:FecR domain-containing protein [Planctomycetota bacterium]
GYAVVAGLTALATGLLVLGYFWPFGGKAPQPSVTATTAAAPASDFVATLVFADTCRWADASLPLVEGQRLTKGELNLVEGLAMVRFDGGATAVLSGDVRLKLESRGSLRLYKGRLTVQAPDEAVGFTVRTPVRDVVDLGTEFAVEVDRDGATELHVLDGAVETREPSGQPGSGHLIRGGEAVRFEVGSSQSHSVTVNAKSLQQLLREAKPKPREDLLKVYEGFQYELGSLPVDQANGRWGWRGPWRLRTEAEGVLREPDSTTDMRIAFQELAVPWPIRGGRAGMLEMPPGDNYRLRALDQPINLAKDAVYYISMMIREEPPADPTPQALHQSAARLTLRSSGDYWGDRVSFALPGTRKPHIEVADFIRFTGSPIAERQSLLWTAKIIARRQGEDEVYFRLYQEGDSLDIVEPAEWSIVSRGIHSDARLDLLVLTSTGETRRWFDELRIGTSWRAVVPIDQFRIVGN